MNIPYWQQRRSLTPQAMQLLRNGNRRFINNHVNRSHPDLITVTADQQAPFATMLSCSDSRVCPELILDLGIGDIFNINVQHNISIILNSSFIIRNLASEESIIIAGAMYYVETGETEFFRS